MIRTSLLLASALTAALVAPPASAAGIPVTVTVTGTVEFNQISTPPLGNAVTGDLATLTFLLDSNDFVNSASFPTRGYVIDQTSFVLTIGTATVGLQSPFPAGQTPYFVIRDNDPGVDGFFTATSIDFPIGVPVSQTGIFGQFLNNYSVTYGQTMLSSLDILDALGTYDFTGLQVYNWTIDDGPFNAMSIQFAEMKIECGPLDPEFYCTGKVNSQGCTPFLTSDAGSPSLSGGPWNVTANDLVNNMNGVFFWGMGKDNTPFQGGTMCVLPPVSRTPLLNTGGNPPPLDCSGSMTVDLTATIPASLAPVVVNVQAWTRDTADPFGSGLTNAVEVLVCP